LLPTGVNPIAVKYIYIISYHIISYHMLSVVLCGCETRSLILREKRRLRVCENRVLRRLFGLKTDKVTGSGENYIMGSLMICISLQILCG
jgi:hypothetical protein